jgi:hypothetical protein
LCELADGVVGNMISFLFTSEGSPTLKYINVVIDHIVEAGIDMQLGNGVVIASNWQKAKISVRPPTHTFMSGGVLHLAVGICNGGCVRG